MRLPGSSAGSVGGACSPCTGRGLTSRPCRQGRWWALTPPFHPYPSRLRRSATGGFLSVPLSVGFRRLSSESVLPCGVRTFLEPPPLSKQQSGPRSPGLRDGLYRRFFACNAAVEAHAALGTTHERPFVKDELAADQALERRSAEYREELLLERPVQRRDRTHSSRNTPTTLPRIWT